MKNFDQTRGTPDSAQTQAVVDECNTIDYKYLEQRRHMRE
jgi:hypothetical protein